MKRGSAFDYSIGIVRMVYTIVASQPSTTTQEAIKDKFSMCLFLSKIG